MEVLFLDTVHPFLQEQLEACGCTCVDATKCSVSEIQPLLKNCAGIVIRSRFPMNEAFLKDAHNLKFIARSGAGMENIDLSYTESRGIVCFNAPEGNRNAVAEHALGMLLSLFNNLNKGDQEVRNGKWDREGNRGIELDGKTVGLIGFGNNGQAFAKKLRGFDVRVLAYDKYKTGFGDAHVDESSLEEIFEHADVLSFHIPQNEETLFMCNRDFLNRFRKPFYLINLSRGKIVRSADLAEALQEEKVLGACLDVLEHEKTSFENLFEAGQSSIPNALKQLLLSERVLLSPHVGGWTHESYLKLSQVLAEKIIQHFALR